MARSLPSLERFIFPTLDPDPVLPHPPFTPITTLSHSLIHWPFKIWNQIIVQVSKWCFNCTGHHERRGQFNSLWGGSRRSGWFYKNKQSWKEGRIVVFDTQVPINARLASRIKWSRFLWGSAWRCSKNEWAFMVPPPHHFQCCLFQDKETTTPGTEITFTNSSQQRTLFFFQVHICQCQDRLVMVTGSSNKL